MDFGVSEGMKGGKTPKCPFSQRYKPTGVGALLWGDTGWWPWGHPALPHFPPSLQKGRAESFAAVPCPSTSDPDKIQQECDFPGVL